MKDCPNFYLDELLKLGNFNGAVSFVAALNRGAIQRMKATWKVRLSIIVKNSSR